MIEEQLAQYGVLGIWTVFNVAQIIYYQKRQEARENKLTLVIENNTVAITRMNEKINQCGVKRR